MAKLPIFQQIDPTKFERINKEVEITLHQGEYDYVYLEYDNGDRVKIIRPAEK